MVTRLLHRLTDASSSRRGAIITIVAWLIIAILLVALAPKLADVYNNGSTQDIPADADSQVATRLLLKEFPGSRGTPAVIVFSDKNGLSTDDKIHIKQYYNWLTSAQKPQAVGQIVSIFNIPQAASQLVSADTTTMTLLVTLNGSTSSSDFTSAVQALREHLQIVKAPLQAYVTGPAGIVADAVKIFSATDVKLLLATVSLVLILLIILYRSPILALFPLIAVGWVLQIVDALIGFAGKAALFGVSQQATSIMTVLLFGAGTDYTIFIVSRYREELLHTQDKYRAMQQTMRAVGEAITSSAGTVILALLTLIFTTIGLYYSLGPALAIAIIIMLLAGLTLAPALLVLLGRAAYWPFVPRYQEATSVTASTPGRGFWVRLGLWTARHRVLAVVGSTILLAILALGNIGSQPTFNFLTAFRDPTDSSQGYNLLQKHFPAGTLAPTTILIQLRGSNANAYEHFAQLDAVTAALQKVDGVANAEGPTRPDGKGPTTDATTLQTAIAALPLPLRQAIRNGNAPATCQGPQCPPPDPAQIAAIQAYAASLSTISPDTTTVQLSVILKNDPYSLAAIQRIAPLRDAVNKALNDNQLGPNTVNVHIAGQTSLLADTLNYNQRDTWLIVPTVLLLVGIVLGLLLRSVVAAVYLLAAVTLNFLATIGVCGFFFQRIEGQDGFNYAIPLYTFIFLVALGADYTIFLMSRVREEAQLQGLEKGVPFAVGRTGGVITSAGLILAGTFAVLTTLPLNILYQFGVCVAVGILLDTFVVRGLLVPGLVLLLGKWNWWPGNLASVHTISSDAEDTSSTSVKTQI
ncbi:MAG: MMPL family transporter [Ktedonobacteraceae bacterium]|nr:MMPL family transporter [Ktedonobacteraceae bacterium]